ncbi:hypothetical protein D3C85_1176210 [compost metagenome]
MRQLSQPVPLRSRRWERKSLSSTCFTPLCTLPKVGSSEPVKRWQRFSSPLWSTASIFSPAPHGRAFFCPSWMSVSSWCRLEKPMLRPASASSR